MGQQLGAVALDTIPNFVFTDITDAALGSWHIAKARVIQCDSARFTPASGDTIKDGYNGVWKITPTWVVNNDTLYTKLVASNLNATKTHSIVYAANRTVVDTFTITTLNDAIPPAKATSFLAIGGSSPTQYNSTWTNPSERIDSVWFYEGNADDTTTLVRVARLDLATSYLRTGRSNEHNLLGGS